jgi:predicted SAM-dependent methyltransferase
VSFTLRTNNGTQYFLAFQSNTDTIRKFKIKKSFFFVCLSVLTITVGSLCVHRKETFDSNPDLRTLCAYYKRIQSTAGELFKKIHAERPLRVYIGSSKCKQPAGFVSTDKDELDVAKPTDYQKLFCPDSVDTFLTEHTFEHITYSDGKVAFRQILHYLKPGGRFRIAVPNDASRAGQVFPESRADKYYGHVSAYGYEYLKEVLEEVGFTSVYRLEEKLKLNETHDKIISTSWDRCDGPIDRSLKYDWRNEEALRKIYPAASLDIRNEIGDMTMIWYADESNNIMTLNERENRRIQGSNVETLMHKVPRILNDAKLAEECEKSTRKNMLSLGQKLVGAPPVVSLIVDAFKPTSSN